MTPVSVQLLTFFRTGTFGPIELGMSKAQVEALLGKPQTWGGDAGCPEEAGQAAYRHPPIWWYDAMEFHFGCTQQLYLIYCDHLVSLEQHGQVFDLDLWVFDANRKISKGKLMHALNQERIPFQEKFDKYTGEIVLPSDVRFIYDLEGDDDIVTISLLGGQYVQSDFSQTVPDDDDDF